MSVLNIVAHNLPAMYSNRQLGIVNKEKAKSTEKLSSGYKINRSADDAAGLSISEKMRRQIRGLKQGSDNLHDGISFIQTADGYLEEVQDMLQRMNELAIKASNGTNSASDRNDIDNEIQELKQETKRIFKTAKFNETVIFDTPYVPAPEIHPEFNAGTPVLKQISTTFPPGATLDQATAESKHMKSTYTKGGTTYNSASFIDFSGVDFGNISSLDNTGFFSSCCTCTDKYSITFDSSTDSHSVVGSKHYTYTVGTKGCTSASDLVNRIVAATGGRPNNHYTLYEAKEGSPNTLVIYDNRPTQTASGDMGKLEGGVTKELIPVNAGEEIQVFSSGLNADGSVKYGGIELNDVRHTWEELGIEVSADGKTFANSQIVDFKDYKGERIVLNVKAGDPTNQLSRTNYWSADDRGVYIDDIFAATWAEIGIKETDNKGEYSVLWRQQEIWFTVNDGDSKSAVIDGINKKVLNVPYSWDIIASEKTSDRALNITGTNSIRVTNSNKTALDADYFIAADNEGVAITSTDDVAHTKTKWEDFTNTSGTKQYPISDWGLDDKDGQGKGSDLITFDDTATYRYENKAQTDLGIAFSFRLKDEAGLDQAVAALNGVKLNKSFTANNSLTTSAGNSVSGAKPQVRLDKSSLTYETQKAYGRDFDNASAELTGTVSRTLTESDEKSTNTKYTGVSRTNAATAASDNTSVVYVKGADGKYYQYNKNVKTYEDTVYRTETITKGYEGRYSYSGTFAGTDVVNTDGNKFNYTTVTTNSQQGTSIRTETSYEEDTSGTGYTADELNDMGVQAADIYTVVPANTSQKEGPAAWNTTSTTTTTTSNASDTIKLTSSKGEIGNLTVSDSLSNSFGAADISVNFKAQGYATCAFSGRANSAGNTNEATHFYDVELKVPPRKLDIQYDSDNPDYIGIEWMGLNNTIIGIHTTNTKTEESAHRAIDQVGRAIKFVSDTRSLFGAQQNRLEHAVKINDNTAENTQFAESVIRDTDMEKEIVKNSMQGILQQAGQSMLAQADQSNQGVLSLLQ